MGHFFNLENGLPPLYISLNYDNIVISMGNQMVTSEIRE